MPVPIERVASVPDTRYLGKDAQRARGALPGIARHLLTLIPDNTVSPGPFALAHTQREERRRGWTDDRLKAERHVSDTATGAQGGRRHDLPRGLRGRGVARIPVWQCR